MACFSPITGYYAKDVGASGKRGITFNRNASLSGIGIKLPCGRCAGCRLEHARQWAMRCMHEKRLHDVSSFLTLTYRTEDLPLGGTLVKRDLQLFMKRLRKHFFSEAGKYVRFYACGEYGDLNRRPHYHVLLFGGHFEDRKFYQSTGRGDRIYTSAVLDELWGLGECKIGDVTFESCSYVARYIMKKQLGKNVDYDVVGEYGEVFSRVPEFTVMSRGGRGGAGGIGRGWFEKYGDETYAHDSVVMRGREMRPPRFYDGLYEAVDAGRLAMLKRVRRRKARLFRADNTPDRRRVREVIALRRLKDQKRSV